MPKHIEDIIVPERKRSIRDIPIPEGRRRAERYEMPPASKENHSFNSTGTDGRSRRKWIAIGIALLILMFTALSLFDGATLAYVPKSQAVSFDDDSYTARKAGEKGLEAPASGEKVVERKASGTIIVYNTSTIEQRLRATTRFETPDGKIYQAPDAITIPGKKVAGGKENPGTLEVVVYAERPGKEFNIGLTDFTLPGLKGTSLF